MQVIEKLVNKNAARTIAANRCAAYRKSQPNKQRIWFLPTHKANACPNIEQNTGNRNKRNRMNSIFRDLKPTEDIWS